VEEYRTAIWGDWQDEVRGGNSVGLYPFCVDSLEGVREQIPWWAAFVEARRRSQLT
jgi:hypothetical protein